TRYAQAGSSRLTPNEKVSATTSFCRSSRARGTGIASRYRSEDQLASLATVSPQNIATITTSRKPTEANSVKKAKLPAPEVARSTRAGRFRFELPEPPSL